MNEANVWNHVKCLEFVRYEGSQIAEIFCKLCGTAIAGYTEQLIKKGVNRNGVMVETVRQKFQRHHNYGELKIQFTNGSFHVTTCCTSCLNDHIHPDALQEMYWADVIREPGSYTPNDRKRVPERVAASMKGAGGLM